MRRLKRKSQVSFIIGRLSIGILIALSLAFSDADVHVVPLTFIATGNTVTVTTAGTAVQLDTTSQEVSVCSVKAFTTNTGDMYVGDSRVSNQWYFLDAGEGLDLDIHDPSEIWIDADISGEGVKYVCTK